MGPLDFQQEEKQPAALSHFRNLRSTLIPASAVKQYLLDLKTPKTRNTDTFISGVQGFTKIANLNSQERNAFFGDKFAGLHYSNDLAKLLNEGPEEKIKAYQLYSVCPSEWDYQNADDLLSLIYRGDTPSFALDKLLLGPTVIDCSMFCQLSIWFGIRNMLGDTVFNQVFGNAPFYITQISYDAIENPQKPYRGNPLIQFFTTEITSENNRVSISHVSNNTLYRFKHPGGNYGGENCIVIDGKYTIFDPSLEKKLDMRKMDVEQLLLESFNAEQNVNDHDKLVLYAEENATAIHPALGLSFGALIYMAKFHANSQADMASWQSSVKISAERNITFNMDRFTLWLAEIEGNKYKVANYTPYLKINYVLVMILYSKFHLKIEPTCRSISIELTLIYKRKYSPSH